MTGHVAKMEPDDFGPLTDLNRRRYSDRRVLSHPVANFPLLWDIAA